MIEIKRVATFGMHRLYHKFLTMHVINGPKYDARWQELGRDRQRAWRVAPRSVLTAGMVDNGWGIRQDPPGPFTPLAFNGEVLLDAPFLTRWGHVL